MYGRMENCKCIVCSSDASKQSDYDDLVVFLYVLYVEDTKSILIYPQMKLILT